MGEAPAASRILAQSFTVTIFVIQCMIGLVFLISFIMLIFIPSSRTTANAAF
jgi:hypothetical protein